MGEIEIPGSQPSHRRVMLAVMAVLAMMSPLLLATPAQAVVNPPALSSSAPASLQTNLGLVAWAPNILLRPSSAIASESVTVTGKLPGLYSRPVWVQRRSGTGWVTMVKATTTSAGLYSTSFKSPALGSYAIRTLAPQTTVAGRLKAQYVSGATTLSVVAQTAALTLPNALVLAKTGTATLTFRPIRAGRAVALQILRSGAWTSVVTGEQSSTGTAALAVTGSALGTSSYRALTLAADGAPAFASPTRTLVVTAPVVVPTPDTKTTLESSSVATSYDTVLTLTASVAGVPGTPTGSVRFTDTSNGSVLAVESLSGGVARLTTRALAPGSRNIVATYSGDSTFSASVSTSLVLTVAPSPRTVATAFQNNSRHDGMATGDTFTPATLHRAWSTDLNPAGGTSRVSYPLIAGGRVFVISSYAASGWTWVSELHALDATTGSVDWTAPISSTYPHLGLTYDGGQVFVQNTEGDLTAHDAATGHINWASTPQFQWSFDSPPTAYNGVLYATGGGFGGTLYAVSETNGALMWSSPVANGNHSSPTVDDSGVYVHFAGDVSYGFGLDGTCRWYTYFGTSGGGGATAVLNGGHLYLHAGIGGPGALILSTDTGASTGTFGGIGLPAFDAENMYVVSGGVLNAVGKDGSSAHWSFTGDGAIDTTPVTTNGIVFTGSSNGNLYGIDSSTGAQVWTAVAPGPVSTDEESGLLHTGLAAADGLLAVPAGGILTVYTN